GIPPPEGARMSGHIDEKAGFLAALAKDDPERKLAEEHARSCATCRDALEEGQRLVELLAEALPLSPPTPETLGCAAHAIEREAREEDRAWRLITWAAGGAMVLGWILQLFYSKRLTVDTRSIVTSLGVLGLAIAAISFVRERQRYV